jgi:hypothetical protein
MGQQCRKGGRKEGEIILELAAAAVFLPSKYLMIRPVIVRY